MSHDTGMLRAKVRQSLDRIGHNNGHACPSTTSNVDPLLHELFVSAEISAYAKTRYDAAKDAAMNVASGLDDAVQSVINMDAGTSVTLAAGDAYVMTCDISKPASRLDSRALRSYMIVQMGIDPAKVDKAFDACTTKNAPAKKIKVASR